MIETDDRIAIVAGSGQLPVYVARGLKNAGHSIYVAALKNAADPALEDPGWETGWYGLYSLQGLLDGLRQAGASKVVLAGKVGHGEIFSTGEFDVSVITFLQSLKDHRPSTILGGLVDLLEKYGFPVLPITETAYELLPSAGHLAGPPVKSKQIPDLQFGWRIAREIADMDIGQTVIVKSSAVVSVEAMEGTDLAIERAGHISRGGLTVVKLAASNHDFKYDVPVIGVDTVEKLIDAGGGMLVVEAKRSIVLEAQKLRGLCDRSGITLVACRESQDGGVIWPET